MKKLFTLLLALIMVVGVLAACNNSSTGPEPTKKPATSQKDPNATPGDGTPGATDPIDTTPIEKKLNIDLESLDYGNREFYIYHWATNTD